MGAAGRRDKPSPRIPPAAKDLPNGNAAFMSSGAGMEQDSFVRGMFMKKAFGFTAGLGLLALASIPATASAAPGPKPPAFAMCAVCHKVNAGEKSAMGPNLWGVGNRKAAVSTFAYSPAMKQSNITWTRDKLIAFVTDPRKTVPGTKMVYAGQKDPKVAAQIADYLLSLK
jgi:cytochrome c